MTGTARALDNPCAMQRFSPKESITRFFLRPAWAGGLLGLAPFVAAVALALPGCVNSKSEVLDASRLDVFEAKSFAWVEEPMEAPKIDGVTVTRIRDDELIAQTRRELTAQLVDLGYRITSEEGAAVHLALRLDVSEEQRQNDPFFTVDPFERFERGHLTLAAFVPVTYEPVWRASAALKLRDTARGMGQSEIRWEALDEARDWRLPKLGRAVLKKLP